MLCMDWLDTSQKRPQTIPATLLNHIAIDTNLRPSMDRFLLVENPQSGWKISAGYLADGGYPVEIRRVFVIWISFVLLLPVSLTWITLTCCFTLATFTLDTSWFTLITLTIVTCIDHIDPSYLLPCMDHIDPKCINCVASNIIPRITEWNNIILFCKKLIHPSVSMNELEKKDLGA